MRVAYGCPYLVDHRGYGLPCQGHHRYGRRPVKGYFGGLTDSLIARFIDWLLAIPFLLFAISLVAIIGPSLTLFIIVIGFFDWASVARIVRGQVLSIKEKEYIEAARALGASPWRTISSTSCRT